MVYLIIKETGFKTLVKMFPFFTSPHQHSIDDLLKKRVNTKRQI